MIPATASVSSVFLDTSSHGIKELWAQEKPKFQNQLFLTTSMTHFIYEIIKNEQPAEIQLEFFRDLGAYIERIEVLSDEDLYTLECALLAQLSADIQLEQIRMVTQLLKFQNQRSAALQCCLTTSMTHFIYEIIKNEQPEEIQLAFFRKLADYIERIEVLSDEDLHTLEGGLLAQLSPDIQLEQIRMVTQLTREFTDRFFTSKNKIKLLYSFIVTYPAIALPLFDSLIRYFNLNFKLHILGKNIQVGKIEDPLKDRKHYYFLSLVNKLHEDWRHTSEPWISHALLGDLRNLEIFFATVSSSGRLLDNSCSKIGRGSYGDVYALASQHFRTMPRFQLAVKVMNEDEELDETIREASWLDKLGSSTYVVDIINLYPFGGIVIERWGVDLYQFSKDRKLPIHMIAHITHQLMYALIDLKKCQVVHCDLKPGNVLIDQNSLGIKFADVGLAANIGDKAPANSKITRWYAPPNYIRQIDGDVVILPQADWWSVGCIIVELVTHKPLFTIPTMDSDVFSSEEKYIQHTDRIFASALGTESGSETPKLVSIIKSSVTEDERDSPLVNKICRVAIGMLQIEPDKRLDPEVVIADF